MIPQPDRCWAGGVTGGEVGAPGPRPTTQVT
jgi:hypothetical protein